MSSTRQIFSSAVLSERHQALLEELRQVEKLRRKLRHVEARTIGPEDGVPKRAAEQEPFRDPAVRRLTRVGSLARFDGRIARVPRICDYFERGLGVFIPAVARLGDDVAVTCRQPAGPGCPTTLELTRRRDRPSIRGRALAPTFIRRCTSEHGNKSIAFPKLNVVLVMHLLGSASRRLLVNAVELCSADHLPAAVHHEHFVPHDAGRPKGRPSS
ncbi:hypothetical protein ACVWW2_007315 [Bradyrhizobium sp. LM4.3]